ncbi:type II 3-dehydroquinate dehydratase [Fulvivirga sp. RKSG066]|uniref:type II 3-dehydroquinate dehydratase n=1 Tax=Fulvivirga aurantia TaxID=2529383 RepID=UPI0012BB4C4A|nr:type II 3-dehydroquinate dehydratase [Fulvivirga aurantia]MTI21657.1 type II 3-dehydroquinate dehydratase [Fulvivirga aurantia]
MKIIIINGPNLNLLGKREPEIYGDQSFDQFFENIKSKFPDIHLDHFQSNIEGEIVNKLQQVGYSYDGIILNAAAYTHTSVAISDAIAAIESPVLEVHISNIYAREEFRHKSIISANCIGMISGLGIEGYLLALSYFKNHKS